MPYAAIEPLESRRHFSASIGLDPAFGTIYTRIGLSGAVPRCAVALPGGRLLVYGTAFDASATDGERGAFALYGANGGLVSSFSHHHPLILDAATSAQFSQVQSMSALPDGSVIVEAHSGVHRLRLDGTFDADFGNGGVLPKQAFSARVQTDGTIEAIQTLYDSTARAYRSRLITLNDQGRYLSATDMIPGRLDRLSDGRPYESSGDGQFTLYDAQLRPDATFGTDGSVDVTGAINHWVATHGPWYQGTTKVAGQPQAWADSALLPLAGGGYAVHYFVTASHAPTAGQWAPVFDRFVRLDAQGHVFATGVTDDTYHYAGTRFRTTGFDAARSQYTYGFQFSGGGSVAVTLPPTMEHAFASARAADGSYFILGEADPGNGSGFAIVRTLPVVGTIAGTLFSDTNANGRADPNEARLGDRVVYLDANDNGRLDTGEIWTTSGSDGRYTFDDLGPGRYLVRRVIPRGFALTRPALTQTLTVGQTLTVSIGTIAV